MAEGFFIDSIKPTLSSYAEFVEDGEEFQLIMGEYRLPVNKWAKDILVKFDGTRTVEDVIEAICTDYPGSDRYSLTEKVATCLKQVWNTGLFVGHDIDERMAIWQFGKEGYACMPGFCLLSEHEPTYIDPSYKQGQLMHINEFLRKVGRLGHACVKYRASGHSEGAILFSTTSCPRTFHLIAAYGMDITKSRLCEMRPAFEYYSEIVLGFKGPREERLQMQIHYLENTRPVIPEASDAFVLRREIAGRNLIAAKVEF